VTRALNEFTSADSKELSVKLSHNAVKLCQRENTSRLILWVKPARQLSPTEPLAHSATVDGGVNQKGKVKSSWAEIWTD